MVKLPVPFSAITSQSLSTRASRVRTMTIRTRGCSAPASMAVSNAKSECFTPLAYFHVPVTRTPPSAGRNVPVGADTAAMMGAGLSPNTMSRPSRPRRAPAMAAAPA